MLTRKDKEKIVSKLAEDIKDVPVCVFVDFKGFGANDMVTLKRELRVAGSSFQVIKKTLLAIVLKDQDITLDPKDLDGQIAISLSSDEVTSAKILAKTAKNNDNIKIVGGIMDGVLMSAEEAQYLATLPSLEELQGQFVGLLQSPARNFVGALTSAGQAFAGAMQALADKKVDEA